jgi:hypothetical protein
MFANGHDALAAQVRRLREQPALQGRFPSTKTNKK